MNPHLGETVGGNADLNRGAEGGRGAWPRQRSTFVSMATGRVRTPSGVRNPMLRLRVTAPC